MQQTTQRRLIASVASHAGGPGAPRVNLYAVRAEGGGVRIEDEKGGRVAGAECIPAARRIIRSAFPGARWDYRAH